MAVASRRVLLITVGCCLAAVVWWARGTTQPRPPEPPPGSGPLTSLAVLPFECSPSGSVSQRAIGVGVADLITLRLRQMPGVRVSPFTEVLDLPAGAAGDPRRAGERLGVRSVLSGQCGLLPGRASLKVRLTDVATGVILWQGDTSAEGSDPQEIERALSGALLDDLSHGTAPPEKDSRPLAHYLCTLARARITTMRSDAPLRALSLLETALEQDPDLAEAHTELAAASIDVFLGGLSATPAWPARAVAAARRAVHFSPGDARAHFVLGRALLAGGEPVEATRETLRAVQLDPQMGIAHMQLAGILIGAGPVQPALAAMAHARRLDPGTANGWVDSYLAILEGRGEEQIARLREEFDRRRAARESLEQPAMLLAWLNASSGHGAEALSWLAALEGVTNNDPLVDLIRMRVMSSMGERGAVQRLLESHRAFYEQDWQYCTWIAETYGAAGQAEDALSWVQRAVALGSVDAWTIETMEGLAPLRQDPRLVEATRTLRRRADAVVELAQRMGYS